MKSEEPVWDASKFTVYGKWMDGWESRRKRTEGYDWCIIKLNIPGDVHSFEIDTCHFTGNYSPMVSVQACYIDKDTVGTDHSMCTEPVHVSNTTDRGSIDFFISSTLSLSFRKVSRNS